MKHLLCALLSLALALSCAGAFAQTPTLSEKMTEVTRIAKTVLDIGDEYTQFEGNLYNGRWHLNWSSEGGWVSVMCLEDGTVLQYSRDHNDYTDFSYPASGFTARFPKLTPEELEGRAGEFLNRVITGEGLSWEMNSFASKLMNSSYNRAAARGRLLLGTLPTDIIFTILLDPMTGEVTSYYRDDAYTDDLPFPAADGGKAEMEDGLLREAREKLLDAYKMETVYYVTDQEDMARLVWRRTDSDRIALNAQTGEFVSFDLDAAETASAMGQDGASSLSDEAEEDAGLRQLNEAELKGIALYENVLSVDTMDTLLRGMEELILDEKYERTQSNYYLTNEKPCASLDYEKQLGKDNAVHISFRLDAVSGEIEDMYTYSTEDTGRVSKLADPESFEKAASEFIRKYYAKYAGETQLTSSETDSPLSGRKATFRYTFTREHAGYLFRDNWVTVRIDSRSGKVCGIHRNWDDAQEFYEPGELIGLEDARLAWLGEGEMKLMYLRVPVKDGNETKMRLVLCLTFDEDSGVYAVDAESGRRYSFSDDVEWTKYEYPGDGAMLYADEIRTLGTYGVGLRDCGFTAEDALTYRRLAVLVLQAAGYYAPEKAGDDFLRRELKTRFAVEGEIDLDRAMTRAEAMQALVSLAGYGEAAKLEGIYTSSAKDFAGAPEDLKGSLAIAQALSIVDLEDNAFAWEETAAAAMCAHAIYVLLNR